MVKVAPMVRSFNGGVFSPLMSGRTDIQQYPASMQNINNCIITPQGPVICRSGTKFVVPARSDDQTSALVGFTFSDETAQVLEFCKDRIRFMDEDGIQTYAPVAATVAATTPMQITSAGLNGAIGGQVALSGFPDNYNLNGKIANITNKVGTTYTLDINYPVQPIVACQASLVYSIALPYTEAQRQVLRVIQDVDIMYLLVEDVATLKLSRFNTYDWRLTTVSWNDGPYIPVNETTTTLTPSATGNAVPIMTTNTAPSGLATGSGKRAAVAAGGTFLGRTLPLALGASDFFQAFDSDDDSYWAGDTQQTGIIEYDPAAGFICTGYMIYPSRDNQDTTYLATDFAPSTWRFEGWNGSAWILLDHQENYVLYDSDRSVFFELDNTVSYTKYRLNVKKTIHNGPLEPRLRRLVMRSSVSTTISWVASSIVGINNDTGFQASDVGRLFRVRATDTFWRAFKITAVADTTHITSTLLSDPLPTLDPLETWRLGLWSDTTGYPSCGELYGDRLWLGGTAQYPNVIVGSNVDSYEDMTPSEADGEVLDTNSFVGFIKSRKLSRIKWVSSDDRGLVLGTGAQEYVVSPSTSTDNNITPLNAQAKPGTHRGSAAVEPVRVDDKLLFVQRNARTLRSLEYSYAANGYTGGYISPSKSQFASHLGAPRFVEIDYSPEPHSILWVRRGDNSVVGFTYNPAEGVEGWHTHDFAGAEIESIVVITQLDQQQDTLWMQTRRLVNGVQKRYIEYMVQPWDFAATLDDAHYVDCGLRYQGAPVTIIYNLDYLEGQSVYGLADQKPIGPLTVVNGSVIIPFPASNVVLGLGFDSDGTISRLENGAQNGTAQGKTKRINSIVLSLWDTACGQVGVWNAEKGEIVFEDIKFEGDLSTVEDIHLFTGLTQRVTPSEGYDMEGSVSFRRPKETPLPLNIVAIMPVMETQDD